MSSVKAFASSDSPVVIDDKGKTLDGGAHGRVDPENELVAAAIASGRLILAADATEPPPPAGQPSDEQLEAADEATHPEPVKATAPTTRKAR